MQTLNSYENFTRYVIPVAKLWTNCHQRNRADQYLRTTYNVQVNMEKVPHSPCVDCISLAISQNIVQILLIGNNITSSTTQQTKLLTTLETRINTKGEIFGRDEYLGIMDQLQQSCEELDKMYEF